MGKYLDPRCDYTFSKVFAKNPDILVNFLNALLPFKDGVFITDLEYLPADKEPNTPLNKFSLVVVRCKDNNARDFLVEIQTLWTEEYKYRLPIYDNLVYEKHIDKCVDYKSFQPIYSLNIVNNRGFDGNEYFHQFQLAEKGNPDRIIEGIEFIFVELKKFKPQSLAEHTMKRLWLRFLTEINEQTQDVPQELLSSPEICKAMSIVERGAYTDAQIDAYEKYWDTVSTEITLLNGHYRKGLREGEEIGIKKGEEIGIKKGEEIGIKKGEEIGIKKGEEIGAQKNNIENARKMKSKGISFEDIADITGLSIEDITDL